MMITAEESWTGGSEYCLVDGGCRALTIKAGPPSNSANVPLRQRCVGKFDVGSLEMQQMERTTDFDSVPSHPFSVWNCCTGPGVCQG